MRYAILLLALLAGCDNGRYQIIQAPAGDIWRIDTRTGTIAKCSMFSGSSVVCSTSPAGQ